VIELSDKLEGRIAIVENGQHEQYLLKVGDRLKDGDVEDISLKELIFKHDTKERLAISVP
jgi:hypothetical protein